MRSGHFRHARLFGLLSVLIAGILIPGAVAAQNIEAGIHGGWARLGDETPLGSESGAEFGVWLNLWPTDRLAVAMDWAYISRDDFDQQVGAAVFGERERNRQIVDVTLRYHVPVAPRFAVYGEVGGGSLWNNRQVVNPGGLPGFEEHGKESTRKTIATLGVGFRASLWPHLAWVTGVKLHNPGSDSTHTERIVTGLVLSWK